MVEDGGRNSARISDFADAREYLPTYVLISGTTLANAAAAGEVIVVRYADDAVLGSNIERCGAVLHDWRERLRKFGLELHPDKTRLMSRAFVAEVGSNGGRASRRLSTFWVHPHLWTSQKERQVLVLPRHRKRLLAKLKEVKDELRKRMHQPLAEVGSGEERGSGLLQLSRSAGNIVSLRVFGLR